MASRKFKLAPKPSHYLTGMRILAPIQSLTFAEQQTRPWWPWRVHLPSEMRQEPGPLEGDPPLPSSAFLAQLANSPVRPVALDHPLQKSPQPEVPADAQDSQAAAWESHCGQPLTSVFLGLPGSRGTTLAVRMQPRFWSQIAGECTEISPSASRPSAAWAECGPRT